MATNNITPPPEKPTAIADNRGLCNEVWLKWFRRLQIELTKLLPALGSANQILGVNSGGTANEYKTLTEGNGITITHATGSITFTVKQMQLGDILAYAARHG